MSEFSILISIWYRQNARNLPWRAENDPYKIWLSEIILQQTRVDQGMAYYYKFTQNYPTVKDLAEATEDQVLNDWQGLGYYSRARNLHFAAKQIMVEHQGQFPSTYKDIKKLKGVGDYTAAAIASFAFDLPHAVVDGNVYRVLSRLLAISTPIDTTEGKKIFQKAACSLMSTDDPATHNQAIMELGALVCTPKNPKCESCPVNALCLAYENKTQEQYPVKAKKTKVRDRYFHYLVFEKNGRTLLKKRGPNDVWQGLYDFPLIEYKKPSSPSAQDLTKWQVTDLIEDKQLKHILTHQRIHAVFWIAVGNPRNIDEDFIWVDLNDLDNYPMPQLLIRYLESSPAFNSE